MLGVAFVAGTFVFTDTLDKTFNELFTQTETDVVVTPDSAFTPNQTAGVAPSLPGEMLAQVRAVDGVANVRRGPSWSTASRSSTATAR